MIEYPDHIAPDQPTGTDIQAAIALARTNRKPVRLRPITYILSDTVTLGGNINLEGPSESATILRWRGPQNGVALRVAHNWNYRAGGFSLENQAGARGTTIGVLMTGDQISGTQGGGATWDHLAASGFDRAIQVGEAPGRANSEMLFSHVKLHNNNHAAYLDGYNTLNIRFDLLSMSGNTVGVAAIKAGAVRVRDGSGTLNGTDFSFGPGGNFLVDGFRSESPGRFLKATNTTAPAMVALRSCEVSQSSNPDRFLIETKGGCLLTMESCSIFGKVGITLYNPPGQKLVMLGCAIQDTEPFRHLSQQNPISVINGLRYVLLGNEIIRPGSNEHDGWFPDRMGRVEGGQMLDGVLVT